MKLGSYTFADDPEDFTPPRALRYASSVKTYSSVAFYSWGLSVVGAEILLEWGYMTADQFNRLDTLYAADAEMVWDPQVAQKLFHGAVANGPFVAGKTVTGSLSGATGTVGSVLQGEGYFEVMPLSGVFQVGDVITDNSTPAKSATVGSVEIIPKYSVQIKSLDGKHVALAGPQIAFRQDVKMVLLIMGVA